MINQEHNNKVYIQTVLSKYRTKYHFKSAMEKHGIIRRLYNDRCQESFLEVY